MERILVTGALGQIGSELVPALRARYGAGAVVASDVRMRPPGSDGEGPFEYLDCTKRDQILETAARTLTDRFTGVGQRPSVAQLRPLAVAGQKERGPARAAVSLEHLQRPDQPSIHVASSGELAADLRHREQVLVRGLRRNCC